jgi:type I restriction enzyme M protein
MQQDKIIGLLTVLGFSPENGKVNYYSKKYNNYSINVDLQNEKIIYNNPIEVKDDTTSNFSKDENFVVLECVNRLLDLGYEPQNIILEYKWSVGHANSGGKLDILVKDKNDKTYLMIECKTFGKEHKKEKDKMLKDGGQLLAYFQQDKNAQFLCLYSSELQGNDIIFENDIVVVKDEWKQLNNKVDIFDYCAKKMETKILNKWYI